MRNETVPEAALTRATSIIWAAEIALRRTLAAGERRDLLMDNTEWDSTFIRDVVAVLAQTI